MSSRGNVEMFFCNVDDVEISMLYVISTLCRVYDSLSLFSIFPGSVESQEVATWFPE